MESLSSIDAAQDFEGYMEHIQQQEADTERMRDMLDRHETWRQTTWSGWLVRQIQAVGNHIAPFFQAVADAVQTANANESISVRILMRMVQVICLVLSLYGVARIINMVMGGGREIVVEQEVIVEVEEEDDDEATTDQKQPRRSARDKKDK